MSSKVFAVVGGGVAGVCCVEELSDLLDSQQQLASCSNSNIEIVFISGRNGFIKVITNAEKLGQLTEKFDIEESDSSSHFEGRKNVRVVQEDVVKWDSMKKKLYLSNSQTINYDKLCIATGASAKQSFFNPNLITLRDMDTVQNLGNKLKTAKRVVLIGNGGIASELVFELKNVEIVWVIRHNSISATYFDEAAAKFFEPQLAGGRQNGTEKLEKTAKRYKIVCRKICEDFSPENKMDSEKINTSSCALGPHWLEKLEQNQGSKISRRRLHVIRDVELLKIHENLPENFKDFHKFPEEFLANESSEWNLWIQLSNNEIIGCDLVIESTGVIPNSAIWKNGSEQLKLGEDFGILVNEHMETNIRGVFAAGDICTALWKKDRPHWTQIRLWTQARQMGIFSARCMLIDEILLDISLEIFSHVTSFFGYKVILLGDFNAKKLEEPFEMHFRVTENKEFVKILTKNHRICGAVLIGETDLEETVENLILNQTNIEEIEGDLLNPTVDLEDYFD